MGSNGKGGGGGGGGAARSTSLASDLGSILNDPAFGDVVLVSKDGDRVWACRILLAARSPVFEGMLLNDVMREATGGEVPLPSISALFPILEYLYTGSLTRYGLTLHNVFDVIHASRYFLLTQLQELAVSFFLDQAHTLAGLGQDLPKHLSRAVEMLSPKSDTQVLSQLLDAIVRSPQGLDNVAELSHEALCLYLDKTRNGAIRFSASEYSRLRCVLLWCAHSTFSVAEEALRGYLPAQQSEILSSDFAVRCAKKSALLELLRSYQSSLEACFKPWLPHLDLFRVHPQILARVVEPMGIIQPSYLLHIFRFQAMYSKDMSLLRWDDGNHPADTVIHEEGCVLENISKKNRFATAELPITSSTGAYEWDFVVERDCPLLGIGFCSRADLKCGVGSEPYAWLLCCTGELFHNAKSYEKDKVKYGPKFGNGARVRVHIDMVKCTCSFTIDGKACGVAWKNIPHELYPAVAMQSPGRVRIEVVGDEDKQTLLQLLQSADA